MKKLIDAYVNAARNADTAGFDVIELHATHGYLLSSFLSPATNKRTNEYGGSLENRARFPLEVFDAIKAVWPANKAITVRLSAVDWVSNGMMLHDSVQVAQMFVDHGDDGIDVSSGQVVSHEHPAYGRSFQTPFADAIRQQVCSPAGQATIAVGAISSYDDANSILLAGRADLIAIGRNPSLRPAVGAARGR